MQPTQSSKLRVLIGDTSVRSRLVLLGMINAEPHLEVVDTAQNREELLFKAISFRPDLIVAHSGLTLSGNFPAFQPVQGIEGTMRLMVSEEMAGRAITANLKIKADAAQQITNDLARKKGAVSIFMESLRAFVNQHLSRGIPDKRLLTYPTSSSALPNRKYRSTSTQRQKPLCLVVIGASTGGSKAVEFLIKDLEVTQPTAVLVAVHMPEKFTKRLAKRLQKLTHWRVEEGYQGMEILPQSIIIAPGGKNMEVKRSSLRPNRYFLETTEAEAFDTPSVDVLMASAATSAKAQVLGVVMTGMGQDGTLGARAIRHRGGVVIAQNEETSSIFGMAKSAIESGAVHGVFPLGQINSIINQFVNHRQQSHWLLSNSPE